MHLDLIHPILPIRVSELILVPVRLEHHRLPVEDLERQQVPLRQILGVGLAQELNNNQEDSVRLQPTKKINLLDLLASVQILRIPRHRQQHSLDSVKNLHLDLVGLVLEQEDLDQILQQVDWDFPIQQIHLDQQGQDWEDLGQEIQTHLEDSVLAVVFSINLQLRRLL